MGKTWETHEIDGLPAYALQQRIPQQSKYIFLFGAGASFGSDGRHLFEAGQLPPLGKDLFKKLVPIVVCMLGADSLKKLITFSSQRPLKKQWIIWIQLMDGRKGLFNEILTFFDTSPDSHLNRLIFIGSLRASFHGS